jgi:hypothetical protein
MVDTATLEKRLINLEQVVFDLQHKFESQPSSDNWLDRLIGLVVQKTHGSLKMRQW